MIRRINLLFFTKISVKIISFITYSYDGNNQLIEMVD